MSWEKEQIPFIDDPYIDMVEAALYMDCSKLMDWLIYERTYRLKPAQKKEYETFYKSNPRLFNANDININGLSILEYCETVVYGQPLSDKIRANRFFGENAMKFDGFYDPAQREPGFNQRPEIEEKTLPKWIPVGLVGSIYFLASLFLVSWPVFIPFVSLWGPLVGAAMFGAFVYCFLETPEPKDAELVKEFTELGLHENVVRAVIIKNLNLANDIKSYISLEKRISELVNNISNEISQIIYGFKYDTSDVNRSRHVLDRCTSQTLKILKNLEVIETRIYNENAKREDYEETYYQVIVALKKINEVLIEQHKRNLENNTNELEIDIQISNQIFQ